MSDLAPGKPLFVLVDDHIHSARLLSRTLREGEAPAQLIWLGDACRARRSLDSMLAHSNESTPDMIIVDLKAHSRASQEFIAAIAPRARALDIPVVAIALSLDAELRNSLIAAGACAVFERHHNLDAYRAEIAQLSEFWVRETVTWPIRA